MLPIEIFAFALSEPAVAWATVRLLRLLRATKAVHMHMDMYDMYM